MTLKNKAFNDIITFTRASGGGRFNASGVYEWLDNDVPRLDYDPVTLQPLGLLIEEQRANLLIYSEQFQNTLGWTTVNATIVGDSISAPNNTVSAEKVIENTINGRHDITSVGVVVSVANPYTASMFLKAGDRSWVKIRLGVSGVLLGAWFDLSNGTVGTIDSGYTASITPVGDGWYRCSVSFTAPPSPIFTGAHLATGDGVINYQGDGVSGIYIWGAQLEAGAFPTSYIPTVASQVTRSADVASVNTLSPWYNASEGTLYFEGSLPVIPTTTRPGVTLGNAAADNRFALRRTPAYGISAIAVPPGVAVFALPATNPIAGVPWRQALSFNASNIYHSVNGGSVAAEAHSVNLAGIATLFIGSTNNGAGQQYSGHIRAIRYYPRRVANTELQELTA